MNMYSKQKIKEGFPAFFYFCFSKKRRSVSGDVFRNVNFSELVVRHKKHSAAKLRGFFHSFNELFEFLAKFHF